MKILYVNDNATHFFGAWKKGAAPATQLYGLHRLDQHGFTVEVREYGEFQRSALRLLSYSRRFDALLSPLGLGCLLLPQWLRGKTRWILCSIDLVGHYRGSSALRRFCLRAALKNAQGIVCLADFQVAFFRKLGLARERLALVTLGGDPDFFGKREQSTEKFVLACGRDAGRDYPTFLEAVREIDFPVVLVTSEKMQEALSPLPPHVTVLTNIPFTKLRDLYAASAVVVIPSHPQGGSDCSGQTVLLDAWSAGKAVIVTEREWVPTYVEAGQDALVVRPHDPAALRVQIKRLLSSKTLRDVLAQAGHRRVEERFNDSRMARDMAQVLRSFCAK